MIATDICWDTDEDEEKDFLPDALEIPPGIEGDEIAEYLSDQTGFCVLSFNLNRE